MFTAANLTAFWANNPQMRLTADQRARLAQEGLASVADFSDFNEDTLNDAFKNMKHSEPAIPEVTNAAGDVVTAAVPAIRGNLPGARVTNLRSTATNTAKPMQS